MNRLNIYLKVIITVLVPILLIYALFTPVLKVSMPFIASFILTYLLNPIVTTVQNRKRTRTISILIVYVILAAIFFMFGYFLIPRFYQNLAELTLKLPATIEKYQFILNELIIRYEVSNLPDSIKLAINNNISSLGMISTQLIDDIINIISYLFSNFIYILLIPFITFYLLKDGDYLKEKIAMFIPTAYRDDAIVTWYQIDLVLKRFIRGQLLVALIVGMLTSAVLYVLGVKYAFILGFIAGIMDVIPYLGPFLGAIPAVLIAFSQSPILALKTIGGFLLIQALESSAISPKIVGQSVGIHPITVIFVILLSEKLFGVIGMFFAVPVTSIIIAAFNTIINKVTKPNI